MYEDVFVTQGRMHTVLFWYTICSGGSFVSQKLISAYKHCFL